MKWIVSLAVMGVLTAVRLYAGEVEAAHFYVQLVRGGDSDEPLPTGVRPVGVKLREKLGGAFRARNYWEMKREEVTVAPGRPTKVALNPERSVRIEISGDRRTVTTYYKGRAVERRSAPRGDGMTLVGDNRGGGLWFVVVRRDKPGS